MTDQAIPILPSRDFHATVAFYSRLGFQVTARYDPPDPYLILRRGEIELHFFKWEDVDPWSSIAGCYLRVGDVTEWNDAFTAAEIPHEGIPRLTGPTTTDYGMREFALIDVDGNLLRVGGRIGG